MISGDDEMMMVTMMCRCYLCYACNQIVSMCDYDENLDDALCDFVSDHSDSLMRQKWGSVWETTCSKQTSTFCPLFKQSPCVACTFDCLQQSKCFRLRAFFLSYQSNSSV